MGTLTFSPSLYIGMAYLFLSQHFEFRYFWGFQKKMAILGVGRFKWILCCPLFIFLFFFFFFLFYLFILFIFFFFFFLGGGGGGLFNVKFKLFFIVFFCSFKYLFEKVKISLIWGG